MALDPEILRRLRRPLLLTRMGMVAERAVRAFWPLWVAVGSALALWVAHAPVPLVLRGALAGLALWAGLRGALRFRWPRATEAMARLDRRMEGRPLASLADEPAIGGDDARGLALWQAHQARMRLRAAQARAPRPDLRLSARDPFALRYLAALAVGAGLLLGAAPSVGSRAAAPLAPAPRAGAMWEGWAEPPAYTGQPTLYLSDLPDGALSLPQGTRIATRIYDGAVSLRQSVSATAPDGPPDAPAFDVAQDGEIQIGDRAWQVSVEPDITPTVSAAATAERVRGGGFTLPFLAEDDYGLRDGQAEITLDLDRVARRYGLAPDPDPRDPVILDLPMPYSGARDVVDGALADDLSTHPWANLPVIVRLRVADDADQSGQSAPLAMVLPGKRFFEPMAAALIEQRRDLLWAPQANGPRVARLLRAMNWQADAAFRTPAHRSAFEDIIAALDLQAAQGFSDVSALSDQMWALALELEEGALEDARARLERARERLADAMRRGADPAEIAELMDELRAATDAYMDLLAENAEPAESQTDEPDTGDESQTLSMSEIQQMMDDIQSLMDEGRMDEAQALMEQLNQLLDNLEMREGGEGDPSGRRRMEELGDTLRDQQDLSDDAFRDLQDRFNGRAPEPRAGGAEDLAERQRALGESLAQQRRALDDLTGPEADAAREALDQAAEAMDEAAQALERDDLPGALDGQARALESLRDGLRRLDEALERDDQEDILGAPEAEGEHMRRPEQRDPLGRDVGRGDPDGALGAGALEGGDARARAQALLDELRRRAGERTRPEDERAYLERLLDRF